jgi:hypothetical protein
MNIALRILFASPVVSLALLFQVSSAIAVETVNTTSSNSVQLNFSKSSNATLASHPSDSSSISSQSNSTESSNTPLDELALSRSQSSSLKLPQLQSSPQASIIALETESSSKSNVSSAPEPSSASNAATDELAQPDLEIQNAPLAQVTSVSQLSDVQPTDWAFQALQSLVERYGVIAGYPDGTYRGNRALTRYEFAAGLNAALDRVNELIASGLANAVIREDLATLQRLQNEFAAELATLRGRVDSLEARTAELEANQFSTTTKLSGDAIFAVSDLFGDDFGSRNNTVFQDRVRLTLDSSFTGDDRLRTRLLIGNFQNFTQPGNEAKFGYAANTGNGVVLDTLSYLFSVGDIADVVIYANGGSMDNLAFGNVITPFDVAGGRGAITRFGQRPPIYRIVNTTAAAAVNVSLTDNVTVQLGYGSAEPANPARGSGLFNGDYAALGQLTFNNLFDRLSLALTYVHAYAGLRGTASGLSVGLGSLDSDVNAGRPVSSNNYGVTANFKVTNGFQIGGWANFSAVRALRLGDADVWNYAVNLAFPDLGGKGNLGGIVVGVEPRLTGTNARLGAVLGRRRDPDTGIHVEGFYRFAINNNIDITPGVAWFTAPNHDENNADIILGTLRTTFRF